MELRARIEEALKNAIREKNETAKDALRMLLTSVKVKEKEIRRQPSETEIHQVISSLVKQRHDSVEQYRKGGRADLASKEEDEIRVLQDFLPQQLSLRRTGNNGRRSCFGSRGSFPQRYGACDENPHA